MSVLEVEVVEVVNFKLCNLRKTADLYCVLNCAEETLRRTRVLHKQVNHCIWNDRFRMEPKSSTLQISLYNKNTFTSDEVLGTVDILLTGYQNQQFYDQWFPLNGGGNIHLYIMVTYPVYHIPQPQPQMQLQPQMQPTYMCKRCGIRQRHYDSYRNLMYEYCSYSCEVGYSPY